jgi:hypothetical protein
MGVYNDDSQFGYYEFLKDNVNIQDDKDNKDGVHIIIDMNISNSAQISLRKSIIEYCENSIICRKVLQSCNNQTWDGIFDNGITEKTVPWQVYGSQKPMNEKYKLHRAYTYYYSDNAACFEPEEINIKNKLRIEQFKQLSMHIDSNNTMVLSDHYENFLNRLDESNESNEPNESNETSSLIYDENVDKLLVSNYINNTAKFLIEITQHGLLDELDVTKQHDRWIQVCYAFKNILKDDLIAIELFKIFTLRPCREYKEDNDYQSKFDQCVIDETKTHQNGLNFIKNICIANYVNCAKFKVIYEKLYIQYFYSKCDDNNLVTVNTDKKIADLFISLYSTMYHCQDNDIYEYNVNRWTDTTNDKHFLIKEIMNNIPPLFADDLRKHNKLLSRIDKQNNKDEYEIEHNNVKSLTTTIKYIESHNGATKIMKTILPLIRNKNVKINYEYYPNIFCFNDKTFDLHTNEFVENDPLHLASLSTGYDWKHPTDEEVDELMKILRDILPEPDELQLVLIYLSTSLYGRNLESFMVLLGRGRNGKSLFSEFLCAVLGDEYSCTSSSSCIQGDQQSGANPDIANMSYKRGIVFREPNLQKLNGSTIKDLTGGTSISARRLYSNNFKVQLNGSFFLECNQLPDFTFNSGSIAFQERLLIINFPTTFVCKNDVNKDKNKLLGNSYYKTNEFKDKYKFAFFKILSNSFKKYYDEGCDIRLYKTKAVIKRCNQFIKGCNELKSWWSSNYRLCKKNEYSLIRFKDIYNRFINDKSVSPEKRRINQMEFKDNFKSNDYLSDLYIDRLSNKKMNIFKNYDVLIKKTQQENDNIFNSHYNQCDQKDENGNIILMNDNQGDIIQLPNDRIKNVVVGYVYISNDDDGDDTDDDTDDDGDDTDDE